MENRDKKHSIYFKIWAVLTVISVIVYIGPLLTSVFITSNRELASAKATILNSFSELVDKVKADDEIIEKTKITLNFSYEVDDKVYYGSSVGAYLTGDTIWQSKYKTGDSLKIWYEKAEPSKYQTDAPASNPMNVVIIFAVVQGCILLFSFAILRIIASMLVHSEIKDDIYTLGLKITWGIIGVFDKMNIKNKPKSIDGIYEELDISYQEDDDKYHKMDVYFKDNSEKLPVIINIHGGGWMYGTKEINRYFGVKLAQRGYAVFNINYRLAPAVSLEGQVQDIMAAYSYIIKNISDYPADSKRVYVIGDSAGAHLALYTTLINSSDELSKVYSLERDIIDIKGLGLISPYCFIGEGEGILGANSRIALTKEFMSKSLRYYISLDKVMKMGSLPRTFLVTSESDKIARGNTIRLEKILEQHDVEHKLVDIPDKKDKKLRHVFMVNNPDMDESDKCIEDMLNYLCR